MRSILMVCEIHPTKAGAYEAYLAAMGERCRSLGIRCGLLLSGEPIPVVARQLTQAGIEYWVASDWKDARDRERRLVFIREYLAALRRGPWDAVAFQFCAELSVVSASLLSQLLGTRPQAEIWVQHSQVCQPGLLARYFSRMRLLSMFVSGMVVLSKAGKEAVCGRGWPANRVVVIPNGVPLPSETQQRRLRDEIGISKSAEVIVSVGSLIHRKGFDLLLPAIHPLLLENNNRHLVVVGDGPERTKLKSVAESLGISKQVHFLGVRNDVPQVLADSDVFVLASRAEGLTLAVVEAMAAGLPVVATDVGGHRDVIGSSTGIIVPPENIAELQSAMRRLLDQPARRHEMGRAAKVLISQYYSLDRQVDRQLEFFAATVGTKETRCQPSVDTADALPK